MEPETYRILANNEYYISSLPVGSESFDSDNEIEADGKGDASKVINRVLRYALAILFLIRSSAANKMTGLVISVEILQWISMMQKFQVKLR